MLALAPALSAASVTLETLGKNHLLPSLFDAAAGGVMEQDENQAPALSSAGQDAHMCGDHHLRHQRRLFGTTDGHDELTTLEMAKAVIIIFLSGVGVLIGIILLAYVAALCVKKFCCCCSCFAAIHNDGPRYVNGGEVFRDAGLFGMTLEERRRVLERALAGKPYTKPSECPDEAAQEDESCPASAPALTENDSAGSVPSSDGENGSKKSNDGLLADEDIATNSPGACEDCQGPGQAQAQQYVPDTNNHCVICISEYEEGEQVIIGDQCSHMFHRSCLLEWLEKHDVCPYCRKAMITSKQMREAAKEVLGIDRFLELSLGPVIYYDPVPPTLWALPTGTGESEEVVGSSSREQEVETQEDGFPDEENAPTNSSDASTTQEAADLEQGITR